VTVQELAEGWLFSYQSARFLETGNISDSLAGNVPLFVAKVDGAMFSLSPHRPLGESIAAYRACGNPNATLIPEVELVGWTPGASAVTAIKDIRCHSSLGLAEAKRIVDECLGGERCVVRILDIEQARSLVATLDAAGFRSQVRYG
jgi:ribosomal protein L7/L12